MRAGMNHLVSRWVRVVPYFLSAAFYLSVILAVFSPLPILFLSFSSQEKRLILFAAISNIILVGLVAGPVSIGFYFVYCISLAVALPFCLVHFKTLERACAATLLVMTTVGLLGVFFYTLVEQVNLFNQVELWVSTVVDQFSGALKGDVKELKQSIIIELPSALMTLAIVMVTLNLVLILRANPDKIREKLEIPENFFQVWRAPEKLIWPTIAAGALLMFTSGWVAHISLNIFKVCLSVYVLQGLSVISFFLVHWKIQGFIKSLVFLGAVFFMMPMVLGLGFFDLWFDFRKKLRQ